MAASVDDSYDYCQALARRTARNFYYSFLTLSRERRRAMCVLYSFMRVTDDLGDSDRPEPDRAGDLARWRDSLVRALDTSKSDDPVLPALVDVVRRYKVPVKYLLDVIAGVEMDLKPVCFETFDLLSRYCYHVAGAVGLACIHLWGFHDERALEAAVDCGTAFQLTNILRDLGEDAARGRMYLPVEDVVHFGLSREDFTPLSAVVMQASRLPPVQLTKGAAGTATAQKSVVSDDRFARLMEFEVSRAREFYARARRLDDYLDPPGKPILQTMLRIYGGLLDEIERRHYDVFTRRVELSSGRKLLIAGDVLLRHKLRKIFTRP